MSIDESTVRGLREILQKEIQAKELYEKNLGVFADPRFKETISEILN